MSTALLCSIMGWRQAGKVDDSTPCVTVSSAITTLAPCDSRTGTSLPQSSPSPLKTSLGAAHLTRLAMCLRASLEAGTFVYFYVLPKPNCFWGDPYDSATTTSFLNLISNKQTSHNAAPRGTGSLKRWTSPSPPLHIILPEIPACAQHGFLGSQTQVRAVGKTPEVDSDALGWSKQVPHFSFYDLYTGALELFHSFTPFSPATVGAIAMMIFLFFPLESN